MIQLTKMEAKYIEETLEYLVECLESGDNVLWSAEEQIVNSLEIIREVNLKEE